eukprot:CAMPEP_0196782822 /NCGR_PEP_ID=MMETSP1104-20130614/12111_1 /TAXON_ID=33652 /ORGANISM="Cafeteria sp., Strain Caron Lab Isolate" /LENGTH=267 /DNA_ID=CAMNT_0042153067 /DNA_START=21 /DNA_END=824 /DNA_ORIENTATION=+
MDFQSVTRWLEGDGMVYWPQYNWLVTWPVILGVPAAYLVMVFVLKRVMEKREPLDAQCKAMMKIYNPVQVAVCAYMTWGLFKSLLSVAPTVVVGGVWLPNLFGLNGAYNAETEFIILVHYVSKYLDFFDTLFMLLRKKNNQVSFLHVYHHCTISVVWGFLLHIGHGNGTAGYGAWINSVIHVIMYSHYFVTSFGINNPLKKYITMAQIVQFYSCVIHAVVVLLIESVFPTPLAALQVAYHFSMIALFSNFFKSSYGGKRRGGRAKRD